MGRFNTKDNPTAKTSVFETAKVSNMKTHQGGAGFERDPQNELFMLAVSFMGGDTNFYESSDERYERLVALSRQCALDDKWFIPFVKWVRNVANMRTVAGVMACEGVKGRLDFVKEFGTHEDVTSQGTINAEIIDASIARADEPGEILAYWASKYGKAFPHAIKRGVASGATRVYNERSYLRQGAGNNVQYTFRDVIRLTRPKPKDPFQDVLFSYIVGKSDPETDFAYIPKITARNKIMSVPQEQRAAAFASYSSPHSTWLSDAEMDHMSLPAWYGKMDKAAWEAVIPNMGVNALLMNLRNFDKAEVSQSMKDYVAGKITDADQIRKQHVLPMRFLSAFKYASSVFWNWPLEQGIQASLDNVPSLDGRTLVMVDMSGSMTFGTISEKSNLTYADAAMIFGSVLAVKNPGAVDLWQYGDSAERIRVGKGDSVMKVMYEFRGMGGTDTARMLDQLYDRHDRVIIITDEQAGFTGAKQRLFGYYGNTARDIASVGDNLPKSTTMYTWNLAGYAPAHAASGSGNKHLMGGGFSDAAFATIPLLEKHGKGKWPWENE